MKQFWVQKFTDIYRPYRVFTLSAVFFLVGILLASFLNLNFSRDWPIFLLVYFCLLFSLLINFLWKNSFLVLLSFSFIFFFVGIQLYSLFAFRTQVVLPYGSSVEITGRVAARPQVDATRQKLTIEYYLGDQNKNARVLVTAPRFPIYKYDDVIQIQGELSEPPVFSDFNYHDYLKRYLVFGLINRPAEIVFIKHNKSFGGEILNLLYTFSNKFEAALNSVIVEPQASLAAGILLGVKRNIPDSLMNDLNATGLTHIIALSGYNVTILVEIFAVVFIASLGRRRVFIYGSALILFFILMTGASASVVRAGIFSFMILFGEQLGRQADQTNLMLLAAVLMVAFNPYILRYDTGFQLSFLAFAGLIYISPQIKKIFERSKLKKMSEGIKSPLVETLGAQLAVFPLIWYQFGRLSLIAPLSNLLVLPVIPISMLLVFVTGIGAVLNLQLGLLCSFLLWPVLEYVIKIVELLAKMPWASIAK